MTETNVVSIVSSDDNGTSRSRLYAEAMPRPARRLTRDLILDCALDVTEKTATRPGKALTGASLGDALGVDRSAIWRHFEDKDDLLLAVADRMIGLALDGPDPQAGPRLRLEQLFASFMEVFERHPFVGAELGPRNFTRENGNRAWETIMSSLQELGVPSQNLVLEFRVFADVMVAMAAANALQQQRTREQRARGDAADRAAVYGLDRAEFPVTIAHLDSYVSVSDEEVARGFLRSFWEGVASYSGQGASSDRA